MDVMSLVGSPLEDVPEKVPGEECNGRRWDRQEGDALFVGYCKNHAGKGTDHVGEGRCKFHGGAADNVGRENGNYRHGAYSEEFGDDLSRHPRDIVRELAKRHTETPNEIARLVAAQLLVQFHRSEDPRFLDRWLKYCVCFGFFSEGK